MASTLTTTNKWDAIWQDLFGSQPSAGQVATFIAEDEAVGDAATIASLIATSAVQEEVIPVAQIIQLATGLAPTVGQLSGWVAAVQSYVIGGETNGQALLNVAEAWVSNTNFQAQYGTTSTSIIEGIYAKAFGTVPTAGQIAAWSVDTPAEILLAFATSTIYTNTLAPYVTQYLTDVVNAAAGEPGASVPSGSLTSIPVPPTPETWTLATGTNDVTSGSPFDGQNGGADVGSGGAQTIVAGLAGPYGTTATLNGSDSIVLTGGSDTFPNTLEAFFAKSATILGVNIQGVQDFVISVATDDVCSITIAGNTTGAGPVISGLDSVTFNANETTSSLYIGDNASPVQAPGSGPFTTNVNEAIGDGCNGVDVDIAAAAFVTGGLTTIDVNAEVVGGFAEYNGSYIIPCPILGTYGDPDNYDPNWCGYYADSYSITAGASAGGPTGAGHPATGAVGFTDWVVNSTGAESVGSLNIIALGGEGSTSATSLTVPDDGSNTMLFASFQSDSLGDLDWQNMSTINLSGTSGFVTLTGAEAGCDGLLGDLKGPIDIIGGSGNSFYDLTALTFTAAAGSSIQGGSNTVFDATVSELPGWSEVAFNNSVWTEDGASEGGNTVIALSNISIGDDTGSYVNGSSCATQGGSINMANFPLTPLSNPYALIAEPNPPAGTVPFGLPYTYDSTASSLPENPTLGDYLQEGVVPAGFEVLQLLDPDGSTAIELSSNLDILNGPSYFAVNMQDVSDPDEYNVSITGVESSQELVLFVSDGCSPPYCGETISTGTSESVVSGSGSSEVFSIPVLTITNYQNV